MRRHENPIINTLAALAAEAFDLDQASGRFAAKLTPIRRSELKPISEKVWYKCWADAGGRPVMVQGIMETRMVETSHPDDDWRRDLKVKIAWTLAAKLLGLILLWFLFFRGNHS
jgi:hypothetical protein